MKRQIIMEKALELFAENGIIDTSVQQITKHAGISKGAFYLSFKSKDELINDIIDQFMMEFISESDRMVNDIEKEELLRSFFKASYAFREKHKAFSTIYIKEQMHKMNETMFERLHYYDQLTHEIILKLVTKLYPNKTLKQKHELAYLIKTFMQLYQMLAFQMEDKLNSEEFIEASIEKIEIIAQYSEISFVNDDMILALENKAVNITKEHLLEALELTKKEVKDPIIQESLLLLEDYLNGADLQNAIISGLLRNIEQDPQCKKLSYLFKLYIKKDTP